MKKIVVLGVSVASLGAVSLFIWLYSKARSKRRRRVEIRIPNSTVGNVIGRCGGTLKDIISKSEARIHFQPPEYPANFTLCVIKGDPSSVQLATSLINKLVENPREYEDDIESKDPDGLDFQVPKEKLLSFFDELLSTDYSYLKMEHNEAVEIKTENVEDFIKGHTQKLYSPGGDGLIPVYVSAVFNPEKFWIQLIKTKEHAELDRLSEKMSDYYNSNASLNVPPRFDKIERGYLCAAFYEADKRWYRAEVYDVFKNDQNTFQSVVDLYLLDFGESIYEKVSNLRRIPSEYLDLHFQAIECGLANIKASSENWSEEAIRYFENIIHVGQWYTLMARIDFYEDGYRPYVTLIDNNGEMSINIAEKLVENGFGKTLD